MRRISVSGSPRPLRDFGERSDAAANPRSPASSALPRMAGAVADLPERWRNLARGRDRRLVGARVQPPCGVGCAAAQAVVELGGFPREPAELQRLPGIGPYTPAAVACFAFGADIAAPDTNADRARARVGTADVPVRKDRAYEWNQALFDLGREICIARTPRCERCPLQSDCPFPRPHEYTQLRKQSHLRDRFPPAAQHTSARDHQPPASSRSTWSTPRCLSTLQADGLI